jgi:hypothetical protein
MKRYTEMSLDDFGKHLRRKHFPISEQKRNEITGYPHGFW